MSFELRGMAREVRELLKELRRLLKLRSLRTLEGLRACWREEYCAAEAGEEGVLKVLSAPSELMIRSACPPFMEGVSPDLAGASRSFSDSP